MKKKIAMIQNHQVFFKEALSQITEVGSIFPSSKWAARSLTYPLRKPRGTKNILEVGAGTGPVTIQILKDMIPGDKLIICECNSRFIKILKARLEKLPEYQLHKNNIQFFDGFVQDLNEESSIDIIVCALPFSNFTPELCKEIFLKFKSLGKKETVITYFEYIALKRIGKMVLSENEKARISSVEDFFESILKTHKYFEERVWLNVSPIRVFRVLLGN